MTHDLPILIVGVRLVFRWLLHIQKDDLGGAFPTDPWTTLKFIRYIWYIYGIYIYGIYMVYIWYIWYIISGWWFGKHVTSGFFGQCVSNHANTKSVSLRNVAVIVLTN